MIQIEKKLQEGKEPLYYVQINGNLPFALTEKQLKELYLVISQHLFDNLLEQNKDILMRLRNNEPVPKMLNSDKVIERMRRYWPLSWGNFTLRVDEAIEKFKKDFGL